MLRNILILLFFAFSLSQSFAQNDNLDSLRQEQKAQLNLEGIQEVKAPNTNVYIKPPEHFIKRPSINGFIHKGTSTTIQVQEENVPANNVIKTLDKEHFQSQGFELIKKDKLSLNSGKVAYIYLTKYSLKDENYHRIFFFTGENKTVWINVDFPSIVKPVIYKPIIASLKSVNH